MSRKAEIAKVILAAIGISGLLVLALTVPNAVQILKPLLKKKYSNRQISRSLLNLERKKIIGITKNGDKTVVALTKEGKKVFLKYNLEDMKIEKPKKWDGKWHIVAFDIPEKLSVGRKALRDRLKEMGFYMIQKSVWVCPYPCENEIAYLQAVYEIAPFVQLIRADKIYSPANLIRYFNLSA